MADYLDTVERQLAQLTERGAHRRVTTRIQTVRRRHPAELGGSPPGPGQRRRGDVLVFGLALVVAVAVAALLFALRPGTRSTTATREAAHGGAGVAAHRPRAAPAGGATAQAHAGPAARPAAATPAGSSAPGPGGGPVPAGFAPASFTAIGEETWWLLGTARCASPPCTSIVRTTDGGRTFVGIPTPRAPLSGPSGVSQLRFADGRNGFAYGSSLFATHDGGASWHPVSLGGAVSDLAIAGGEVYAIVAGRTLMRSEVGRDGWSVVGAAGGVSGGLWVHGTDVLVQAGATSGPGSLLISHDRGQSFTREPVPPSVACGFEEPEPPVVWAHCATGTLSGVWRSDADGAAFRPAYGGAHAPGGEQPNSAAFGAASATTAVVGFDQLYRTADAGASYAPVGPSGVSSWQYLGFTDATHGVALGYAGSATPSHERLYYTTDGGLTYHLVAIH